jgi:hypothetical protein
VYEITFDKDNSLEPLLDQCGTHASVKQMPSEVYDDLDMLYGIFDGLKNSDGSVKRNTWDFSTTSSTLNEQILSLSGLVGIPTKARKMPYENVFRIGVGTKLYHRLNDQRSTETIVKKLSAKDKTFYCVTVPNHGLLIRTSTEDTVVSGNCTPFEHQAKPMEVTTTDSCMNWEKGVTHVTRNGTLMSGNFKGYIQYRQLVEQGA